MKGGVRTPPNRSTLTTSGAQRAASMKGGVRTPPNGAAGVLAEPGQRELQ